MKIKNKISAKKLMVSFLLLSSVLFFSNCKKEKEISPQIGDVTNASALTDSVEKELPQPGDVINAAALTGSLGKVEVAPSLSSAAYDLTKSLPVGYVKDGSIDYTTYVQAALNKYSEIVFPAFPILVNDKGLLIPSNRKIWFKTGSVIKLKPTSLSSYKIFNIKNVTNVTLVNPVIIGDRQKHIGTEGEAGIGIKIYGTSSNINIYSPKVSYTWGDGIYIGDKSKTILIEKAWISKAGRNGITIVSGINVTLSNPYIQYSDRLNPMAGIDIEPNGTTDELQGIKISNPVTYKNGWTGIQVGMSQFYYDNEIPKKTISIEVSNHKDTGSGKYGVWLSTAGKYSVRDMGTEVSGTLKFTNPTWIGNNLAINAYHLREPAITFTLTNPTIINTLGQTLSQTSLTSLFSMNIGKVTKVITYK
jgi:hypothetical protein